MSATDNTGILLVAGGYELYGSCAVNLAMSLKAYDPSIQICLVHDNKAIAHLGDAELELFDTLIVADEADYLIDGKKQYQRLKLCAYKYSPFINSLYIDVDTIWFPKKKVSDLISSLMQYDFYIGKNTDFDPADKVKRMSNYTYWGDPVKTSRYFGLKNKMPQTISGVFWFKKCEYCAGIFSRALQVYGDKKAPTQKWANGIADEYCFNVSLSERNYQQDNCHIVYFDKSNGNISREQMFSNFWGLAAGGNKLSYIVRDLYNDLVDLYHTNFNFEIKRKHVDKIAVIKERRNF